MNSIPSFDLNELQAALTGARSPGRDIVVGISCIGPPPTDMTLHFHRDRLMRCESGLGSADTILEFDDLVSILGGNPRDRDYRDGRTVRVRRTSGRSQSSLLPPLDGATLATPVPGATFSVALLLTNTPIGDAAFGVEFEDGVASVREPDHAAGLRIVVDYPLLLGYFVGDLDFYSLVEGTVADGDPSHLSATVGVLSVGRRKLSASTADLCRNLLAYCERMSTPDHRVRVQAAAAKVLTRPHE